MSSMKLVFVATLALLLSACGSNDSTPTPTAPTPAPAPTPSPNPAPTNSTTVTIPVGAESAGSAAYGMNPLTVSTGTTVVWRNNDAIVHTATSDTAGVFNTGNISANGGTASFTFNAAGTMRYHCAIHPGMIGTIVVQ